MPHELRLTHDGQIIQAHFHGAVSAGERAEALEALLRRHYESQLTKFLVDFSAAQMTVPSEAELIHYAARTIREPALQQLRVAILCAPAFAEPEAARATLRFPRWFQRFHTREAALRWLGARTPQPAVGHRSLEHRSR